MERKKSSLIILFVTILACIVNIVVIQCVLYNRSKYLDILYLHVPSDVTILVCICVFFALQDHHHEVATVACVVAWLCLVVSIFCGLYHVVLSSFVFYMVLKCCKDNSIVCIVGTCLYVGAGVTSAFNISPLASFVTTIISAVGFLIFLTHEFYYGAVL